MTLPDGNKPRRGPRRVDIVPPQKVLGDWWAQQHALRASGSTVGVVGAHGRKPKKNELPAQKPKEEGADLPALEGIRPDARKFAAALIADSGGPDGTAKILDALVASEGLETEAGQAGRGVQPQETTAQTFIVPRGALELRDPARAGNVEGGGNTFSRAPGAPRIEDTSDISEDDDEPPPAVVAARPPRQRPPPRPVPRDITPAQQAVLERLLPINPPPESADPRERVAQASATINAVLAALEHPAAEAARADDAAWRREPLTRAHYAATHAPDPGHAERDAALRAAIMPPPPGKRQRRDPSPPSPPRGSGAPGTGVDGERLAAARATLAEAAAAYEGAVRAWDVAGRQPSHVDLDIKLTAYRAALAQAQSASKPDGRRARKGLPSARGALVRKIMKERGLMMAAASAAVKAEGMKW